MPALPGEFRLSLPEGVYRVSPTATSQPAGGSPSVHAVAPPKYYVKSMAFGAKDLTKDLMTVQAPVRDTLVINLAKCTEKTQDPLCR
jgi:hypothetical protein